MVSRYDHQLTGLITALLLAGIAYALLQQANDWVSDSAGKGEIFTQRTVALIAICLNVLPMNYFRKRYRNRSLRGLVMGTMLLA
ncbi:MAG: hypothetical protein AAFN92_09815, partial [Bacteroidota bacterium]